MCAFDNAVPHFTINMFKNPVIFNERRIVLYLACILMCSAFKYAKETFLLPLKLQMKKWQHAKNHK